MSWVVVLHLIACHEYLCTIEKLVLDSGVTKPGPTRAWARASILKCF